MLRGTVWPRFFLFQYIYLKFSTILNIIEEYIIIFLVHNSIQLTVDMFMQGKDTRIEVNTFYGRGAGRKSVVSAQTRPIIPSSSHSEEDIEGNSFDVFSILRGEITGSDADGKNIQNEDI